MDRARADALAARHQLTAQGWVARDAEAFRQLPPPPAAVWLGEAAPRPPAGCDAPPLAGAGWTLHPLGRPAPARIDARWLDAADAVQRAELFAGLPASPSPGEADGADDGAAAPFAWAHRALCRQGLRLRIGGAPARGDGAAETVWLHLRHQPRAVVEAPLLVIELAAGVHCVLVESHERDPASCRQPIVQNLQVHLRLGEDATLQHLRIAAPGAHDQLAHHLHARVGPRSRYQQALVASGSRYHLQRSLVDLQGERAQGRSAALLCCADAALAHQARTAHTAPRTASAVEALALAGPAARGEVHAHTRIAPGAAGADARQRLAGIPTGAAGGAAPRLLLRPQLEIRHDDVQAVHGATWGALPEDALFYARQRGLDERAARGLIVQGLAAALLQRCFDDEDLLQALALEPLIAATVARHLTAPENGRG